MTKCVTKNGQLFCYTIYINEQVLVQMSALVKKYHVFWRQHTQLHQSAQFTEF